MKKRLLALALVAMMAIGLCACGGDNQTPASSGVPEVETQTEVEEENTAAIPKLVLETFEPENMIGLTKDELFSAYGKTMHGIDEDDGQLWVQYEFEGENVRVDFDGDTVVSVGSQKPSTGFGLRQDMSRDEILAVLKQDSRILFLDDYSMHSIITFYTEKESYDLRINGDKIYSFETRVGGIATAPTDGNQVADGSGGTDTETSSGSSTSTTTVDVKSIFEKYVNDNGLNAGGSSYFFVDLTQDGQDEMVYTAVLDIYGSMEIFTVVNGKVVSIYYSETDTSTGAYNYHLYKSGGKNYILTGSFVLRQGYASNQYEIFHLKQNGDRVMLKSNSYGGTYDGDGAAKADAVRAEYDNYASNAKIIIGSDGEDILREIY